ncbi:MAG TPA: sulfatase [Thermoguttaceae bacterium]|nr:sulfatase [Thermoguttaceae bacterium]
MQPIRPAIFQLLFMPGIIITAFFYPCVTGQVQAGELPTGRHPNLLLVFADQMRGSAMGFLEEEPVMTPNLDRLAERAIVFTQAASNYPVCSPYRAMLMTGQYPHFNGVIGNCLSSTAPYGVELKADARCWSDVLKENGYSLGYLGKWHLEAPYKPYVDCANNRGNVAWNEWTPPRRRHGFDYWHAYNTYDYHMRPLYWDTDAGRHEFRYVDQWGPAHEADLAIEFIRNEAGRFRDLEKPFALVVSMNPPHTPYSAHPEKYLEPYAKIPIEELCRRSNIPPAGTQWGDHYRNQIRHYYAMITGVDEQFGRIVDALDGAGLAEETVVVFTSDHGNCLGIHGHVTKNVPEEESMRIPLLIRYPGKLKPRREELLISVPDLYPTLLDLMGLAEQIPAGVEGVSHAELLRTGEGKRPTSQLYLWVPCEQPSLGRRGVRTGQYTLVVDRMPGQDEKRILYDNVADPYQLENVAADRPAVVDRLMREELVPWLRRTADPWLEPTTDRSAPSP